VRRPSGIELESLREDGLSPARRREFRDSARAARQWEQAHTPGLEGILAWIDQLRALLGDPPVSRRPWRGSDFRL